MTGPLLQSRDAEVPVVGILDPRGSPSGTNPGGSIAAGYAFTSLQVFRRRWGGPLLIANSTSLAGDRRRQAASALPSPQSGALLPSVSRASESTSA